MEEKNWNKLLTEFLPAERIKSRYIDLIAYANDAGFYHLLPKAVVQPINTIEIQQLFAFSKFNNIPLTFRTGGTSLSGQSISDGLLVDLSKYWRKANAEMNGTLVRVQPGITGAMVNAILKKYKTKIGPDPSSINAAMMGGILANNSSGMCCGVAQNSYHTLHTIRFVLPNGSEFNTGEPKDYYRFKKDATILYNHLLELKNQILHNPELVNKIRHKYKTKNTVGYGLNSFLDYSDPLDILAHLLIGSEGTLAFIAEAVMKTVPDLPFKATVLLYFPNIHAACSSIIPLKNSGAEALELMDRAALRSIEHISGVPVEIISLPETAAAMLCEYQASSLQSLESLVATGAQAFKQFELLFTPEFTFDVYKQALIWKLRKGMFPSVGAVRQQGTSVILEDVAFPLESLADAVVDIQNLFEKHDYSNGIIFGHAKDGNIHFVVSQSFNGPKEISKYEAFIQDVVSLVVNKYKGTLKAEHGTGRNMAPFVATEWGDEAYEIMQSLKKIIDPENLLNPGVIINNDPRAHLKNLKSLPIVEQEVDKCIECGYCEHKCPSRDITMTPRQRIVVRREMARLKSKNEIEKLQLLYKEYQYDGMDTCAVDGLCASECPVSINTGDLIKRLRNENHSAFENKVANLISKNFKLVEFSLKAIMKTGSFINKILGSKSMFKFTRSLHELTPMIPVWPESLTSTARLPKIKSGKSEVVYFPACISRMMGASATQKLSLPQTFIKLADKARIKVHPFESINGLCCGQAFSSKGFQNAAAYTMNKTIATLFEISNHGQLPIVIDVTSCTYTFLTSSQFLTDENQEKLKKMQILDSIEYALQYLIPKLNIVNKKNNVVIHPVCTLTKMNLNQTFKNLAEKCANTVSSPIHAGCCGMAGDRGFFFPELTASAVREEAIEVNKNSFDGYYSSAKTCEISLSGNSGNNYESILYLLDEVSE